MILKEKLGECDLITLLMWMLIMKMGLFFYGGIMGWMEGFVL
jgi:hypothetical protein